VTEPRPVDGAETEPASEGGEDSVRQSTPNPPHLAAEAAGGAATGAGRAEGVARSPIRHAGAVTTVAGWEVSDRQSAAPLTLTDCTPLAKVLVRAAEDGPATRALGVRRGRAARDAHGALVVGSGPGEWLVLGPPGTAPALAQRLARLLAPAAEDELVSVLDLTHGRALMRLTGARSADLLAKVCAIDLAEEVTPDGAAFRSSVARLVTDVVRDDVDGVASYLLHCETSSGNYLFEALLDAGREFGIDTDGFRAPGL
jgi:heterotetrameric sarcosine oxidase gamma subunit